MYIPEQHWRSISNKINVKVLKELLKTFTGINEDLEKTPKKNIDGLAECINGIKVSLFYYLLILWFAMIPNF